MDQNHAVQPYNSNANPNLAQIWENYIQRTNQDILRADQEIETQANAARAVTRQRIEESRLLAAQELSRRLAELERQKRQGEEAQRQLDLFYEAARRRTIASGEQQPPTTFSNNHPMASIQTYPVQQAMAVNIQPTISQARVPVQRPVANWSRPPQTVVTQQMYPVTSGVGVPAGVAQQQVSLSNFSASFVPSGAHLPHDHRNAIPAAVNWSSVQSPSNPLPITLASSKSELAGALGSYVTPRPVVLAQTHQPIDKNVMSTWKARQGDAAQNDPLTMANEMRNNTEGVSWDPPPEPSSTRLHGKSIDSPAHQMSSRNAVPSNSQLLESERAQLRQQKTSAQAISPSSPPEMSRSQNGGPSFTAMHELQHSAASSIQKRLNMFANPDDRSQQSSIKGIATQERLKERQRAQLDKHSASTSITISPVTSTKTSDEAGRAALSNDKESLSTQSLAHPPLPAVVSVTSVHHPNAEAHSKLTDSLSAKVPQKSTQRQDSTSKRPSSSRVDLAKPSISGSTTRSMRPELRTRSELAPAKVNVQASSRYRTAEHANLTTIASDILFALPRAKRPRLDEGQINIAAPRGVQGASANGASVSGTSTPLQYSEPQLTSYQATHFSENAVETRVGSSTRNATSNSEAQFTLATLQVPHSHMVNGDEKNSAHGLNSAAGNSTNGQVDKMPPRLGIFPNSSQHVENGFTIIGEASGGNSATGEIPDTGISLLSAVITDYVINDGADDMRNAGTAKGHEAPLNSNPPSYSPASPVTSAFIEPMSDSEDKVNSRASEGVFEPDTAFKPFQTPDDDPLFLPSPVSSSHGSSYDVPDLPDLPSLDDQRSTGYKLYVEIPRLSEAQKQQYRTLNEEEIALLEGSSMLDTSNAFQKQRRMETPLSVITGSNADNRTNALVSSLSSIEALKKERASDALRLANCVLKRRPCQWTDCDFVAKNGSTLKDHVQEHATKKDYIYSCSYSACHRRFSKQDVLSHHLSNHVLKEIYCPYEGCYEHFECLYSSVSNFVAHVEEKHPPGSAVRPGTEPFSQTPKDLPPLRVMSAYLSVPIRVQSSMLSDERRLRLGPWVLKNIFGPVNLGGPRLDARNQPQPDWIPKATTDADPLSGASNHLSLLHDSSSIRVSADTEDPLSSVAGPETQAPPDQYDFLDPYLRVSTYPAPGSICEIPRQRSSSLLANGAVLIPDKDGPSGPLDEWLLTSKASHATQPGGQKEAGSDEGLVVKLMDNDGHDGAGTGNQSFELEKAVKEENDAVPISEGHTTSPAATASLAIESIPMPPMAMGSFTNTDATHY